MNQVRFIGGGNMARSLIGGLLSRGVAPDSIAFSEPNIELREALSKQFNVRGESDNQILIKQADVIVLAVKPQVMKDVCLPLREILSQQNSLVVSIAAGISISAFEAWLGSQVAIVRAMPNTPAMIGAGATGMVANSHVSVSQRALAKSTMDACGVSVWIENEIQMDAVTALSGSGPAYFFLLLEAMIDAGMKQGLAADAAKILALQTALGAARMAIESDEDPARLRQRVTSPNGTTAAAIEVFEQLDFRRLVDQAISRATERGKEMAAQFGQ